MKRRKLLLLWILTALCVLGSLLAFLLIESDPALRTDPQDRPAAHEQWRAEQEAIRAARYRNALD